MWQGHWQIPWELAPCRRLCLRWCEGQVPLSEPFKILSALSCTLTLQG